MRESQEPRGRDDFLVRTARFYRSSVRHSLCLLSSVLLLAVGAGVLVYAFNGFVQHAWVMNLGDLSLAILGMAGVAAGWGIRLGLCIARVAHEVLLRLDDDHRSGQGTEVDRQTETHPLERADVGSNAGSPFKSWLRELSTRELSVGWRFLVMVPLGFSAALSLLVIAARRFPGVDEFLHQRSVHLEYLCVCVLVLMSVPAYMMLFWGIICKRANTAMPTPKASR